MSRTVGDFEGKSHFLFLRGKSLYKITTIYNCNHRLLAFVKIGECSASKDAGNSLEGDAETRAELEIFLQM